MTGTDAIAASTLAATATQLAHRYQLFGLQIATYLPMPELAPAPAPADLDLRIEAEEMAHFGQLSARTPVGMGVSSQPDCFSVWMPGIGGLRITPGRIGVALAAGQDWAQMRPYLLGTGLAAALCQLSVLPHHVSAVSVGGRVVAFTGPSGAGKSTFAYEWMRQFSAQLVSDDLARIELSSRGVQIHPGLARVKLWRDALGAFDLSSDGLSQELQGREKFYLHNVETGFAVQPLAALVLLETDAALASPLLERVNGAERLMAWRSSLYRPEFAQLLLPESTLARHLMGLSMSVPVYRFRRGGDLSQLPQHARRVRDELSADGCIDKLDQQTAKLRTS